MKHRSQQSVTRLTVIMWAWSMRDSQLCQMAGDTISTNVSGHCISCHVTVIKCRRTWQHRTALSMFETSLITSVKSEKKFKTLRNVGYTLKLTLSPPIPLRLNTLPYWSNPPFLIFDIRALWRSVLSARAPECQKLKLVG